MDADDLRPEPRSYEEKRHAFTIDDIPPSKWRERFLSFYSWLQSDRQYYDTPTVIRRFIARLEGRIKEWYIGLGEYRQQQVRQLPSIGELSQVIYTEFLGRTGRYNEIAREEYLQMKCCSFLLKHIEKYYDRMSKRFYAINGMYNVNLKQAFLNSFPEPLGAEAMKLVTWKGGTLQAATIAHLYELIIDALERLCNQRKFLQQVEKTNKQLIDACKKDYLKIKCKKTKSCDCSHSKKKKHFKRSNQSFKSKSSKLKSFHKKKKWKFVKRKFRGKRSDRCFLCHKPSHFAKNCPKTSKKDKLMIHLMNLAPGITDSDLESVFFLEDEQTPETIISIAYFDIESDDNSPSP